MGGVYRRKKTLVSKKEFSKKCRTRRRTKDLDQIHEDLLKIEQGNIDLIQPNPDLPGLGQHYCPECSFYAISSDALTGHKRGKTHKKRLKLLLEVPYTIEESIAASGMGNALITQRKPLIASARNSTNQITDMS